MSIIVSGSTVFDRIMDFPGLFSDHILPQEIHKLNVSFVVREFKETFGGAAANIAYNLALLKETPLLYSAVGKDFGKYGERLKKLNINLSGVKVYPQTFTASAYIITDKSDNQITGFFPGAMSFYASTPKATANDLAIISPGNANEMLDLAENYFKKKVPFIFDPGQQIIQFTKNQLRTAINQASIYIVNDYELSLTKKITGWPQEKILKAAKILIVTLGKQGSVIELCQGRSLERVKIKPAKVKVVKDPTGAGDAYRAGLIKGLLLSKMKLNTENYFKLPWIEIGQIASLASVYAVEEYGTQAHSYTLKEFKDRYFKEFKSTIL
ncbi:MAG: carbohydrate kinase family protein [Candidatus Komeilibacteria bacterium]|nr:carbohydrate kinase family protein [Candidatus Komeilibacteria bacterium]